MQVVYNVCHNKIYLYWCDQRGDFWLFDGSSKRAIKPFQMWLSVSAGLSVFIDEWQECRKEVMNEIK